MHSSLTKFLFTLLSLTLLPGLGTAKPLPTALAATSLSLNSRQDFSAIYTGDLCDSNLSSDPGTCFLGTYLNSNSYEVALYAFRNNCELIGYSPGKDIEQHWYSFDSQLPYSIVVRTEDALISFWYAGRFYDRSGATQFKCWEENDFMDSACLFPFSC
jgi:hypothetical protein